MNAYMKNVDFFNKLMIENEYNAELDQNVDNLNELGARMHKINLQEVTENSIELDQNVDNLNELSTHMHKTDLQKVTNDENKDNYTDGYLIPILASVGVTVLFVGYSCITVYYCHVNGISMDTLALLHTETGKNNLEKGRFR
jgi:hypothetical protein